MKEIADYVAQLRRVGRGLGVYEFDKLLAERAVSLAAESVASQPAAAAPEPGA